MSMDVWAPVAENNTTGTLATVSKFLPVATYAPSVSISLGSVSTAAAKMAAGVLLSLKVVNRNAAARYLLIFNSTGGTGTIYDSYLIPGSSMVIIGSDLLTPNGLFLSTGISWGMSTSNTTYTAATAAETDVTIYFK